VTKRGPWRLIEDLGSSPTHLWVFNLHPWFFLPFGVDEGEDLRIGGVDAKGRRNWSMEQLPIILKKGLHLLFGFHL